MPVSKVVRRMRGGWNAVIFRSEAYAVTLPPEGVSGAAFEKAVLSDVDPRDCDEVLRLLHRRRVVWVGRNRGAVRVYRERPAIVAVRERSPMVAMISSVAPHVLELLEALEMKDRDGAHVCAARAAALATKHAGRDGLPAVRKALWRVFPAPAMKLVVFHAPRLDPDSPHERMPDAPPPRPKRIASDLSLDERVFRLIEKAGAKGVSRTDLVKAIPKVRHQDVEDVTAQLASADMIVSGRMRFGRTGRHGTRYFTAEIGLPRLTGRGEVIVE